MLSVSKTAALIYKKSCASVSSIMGMLSKAITVGDIELTQFLSFGVTKSTKVFIVDSIIYKYIFNNIYLKLNSIKKN